MTEQKGFMGSLFDLSFTEFVTTKIIKFLFILAIVAATIAAIIIIVTGFKGGFISGIISLILSPIAFLLYVVLARMWLELVIVIFRIAENTGRLVDKDKPEVLE